MPNITFENLYGVIFRASDGFRAPGTKMKTLTGLTTTECTLVAAIRYV